MIFSHQRTDAKRIARFVRMVKFYRRFIPKAAELAAPLNELCIHGSTFVWGNKQPKAFVALKMAITPLPVLRMPDFSKPFIMQTIASSLPLGAVLSQEADTARQPVAFIFQILTEQEKKSSVYQLEGLAIVFTLDKWHFLDHT